MRLAEFRERRAKAILRPGRFAGGNWASRAMLIEQRHCWRLPGHRLVLAEILNNDL
jgi:hypothetical protein